MKIKAEKFISDLVEQTEKNLNEAEDLNQKSLTTLNFKSSDEKWNALECIEHLNLYSVYYLREIEKRINRSNTSAEEYFKSGIIGNYFAKTMLPEDNFRKMKTFKDKDPSGSSLNKTSIQKFLADQQLLLTLLKESKKISLNKTKVPLSISKWIKLRLGDVFRVVIYHNQRHLLQAKQMLNNL